ncbi:hypothetical protein, partial [Escherichia coli]|uniref:hypothetical protein n=1 Tax=Escherichia coli TaxID=562 RepID=UPI0028DD7292
DMIHSRKEAYNLKHLKATINVLRIKSIDELFEIQINDETGLFDQQHEQYRNDGITDDVIHKFRTNAVRLGREHELRKK